MTVARALGGRRRKEKENREPQTKGSDLPRAIGREGGRCFRKVLETERLRFPFLWNVWIIGNGRMFNFFAKCHPQAYTSSGGCHSWGSL